MRILFRVDFGSQIGLGHLSRAVSLAKALLSMGHEPIFAIRPDEFAGPYRAPSMIDGMPVVLMTPTWSRRTSNPATWLGSSEELDAAETLEIAEKLSVDMLVIDHYGIGNSWVRSWRKFAPMMQISDSAALQNVDIVLDYGFDANPAKHALALESGAKAFLGAKHALLSPDYAAFATPPKAKTLGRKTVMVSLGGGSNPKLWQSVHDSLHPIAGAAEVVFVGMPSAFKEIASIDSRIKIRSTTSGLFNEFLTADFAIVAAGVSMYELLASGLPGFVLATASNQEPSFNAAIGRRIVNGAAWDENFQTNSFLTQIRFPESGEQNLNWLWGRSHVDHYGAIRVAQGLGLGHVPSYSLRDATEADAPFLLRLVNQPSVIQSSFTGEAVTTIQHMDWFASGLKNGRRIWIFELNGLAIGQCRLDIEAQSLLLDYSLDESFHGRGLGVKLLEHFVKLVGDTVTVVANVKPDNRASLSALQAVGFRVIYRASDVVRLEKNGENG